MMPDPRTVEAVKLLAVNIESWDSPWSMRWAKTLADMREKHLAKRNPWKRPPWQIGRRVNAKQVKR